MTEDSKKNPLGPTGVLAARRVRELREELGWTYQRLAEELAARGRPIPTLGLRRIETEARRIDVDDLVALAVTLGVNPNALILPVDPVANVEITGAGAVDAQDAWQWAWSNRPLPSDDPDDDGAIEDRFIEKTRPWFDNQPKTTTRAGRRRYARTYGSLDRYRVEWDEDGEVRMIWAVYDGKEAPLWDDESMPRPQRKEGKQ